MRYDEGTEMFGVPKSGRGSANASRESRPVFALPIRLEFGGIGFLYRDANASIIASANRHVVAAAGAALEAKVPAWSGR